MVDSILELGIYDVMLDGADITVLKQEKHGSLTVSLGEAVGKNDIKYWSIWIRRDGSRRPTNRVTFDDHHYKTLQVAEKAFEDFVIEINDPNSEWN